MQGIINRASTQLEKSPIYVYISLPNNLISISIANIIMQAILILSITSLNTGSYRWKYIANVIMFITITRMKNLLSCLCLVTLNNTYLNAIAGGYDLVNGFIK